jgi:MFS family permease
MGKQAHNAVFLVMYLPYGVCNGFFTVTLAYLLSQSGVSTFAIAGMASLCLLPLTWSIVWAPVTDSTLSYRLWYLMAALLVGGGTMLAGFLPVRQSSLFLFDVLAFATALASTFIGQTTSALAAHNTQPGEEGGASGWMGAGNIGGNGLGGGLGLWLAHHFPQAPWLAAMVLGGICMAAALGLYWVREPVHGHRTPQVWKTLKNIGREALAMARSRTGLLAIVLLLMPMGTGAMAGLWSAVAGDWKAGADLVALVAGAASGVLSALGALLMGRFGDRLGPKPAYIGGAFLMSAITLMMAFAPRTPATFLVFALLYAFVNGFMYASFYMVMLEAIGKACAATKAPIFSNLTNIPILVVTLIDGKAQGRFGSSGMLAVEACLAFAAMSVYGLFWLAMRGRAERAVTI